MSSSLSQARTRHAEIVQETAPQGPWSLHVLECTILGQQEIESHYKILCTMKRYKKHCLSNSKHIETLFLSLWEQHPSFPQTDPYISWCPKKTSNINQLQTRLEQTSKNIFSKDAKQPPSWSKRMGSSGLPVPCLTGGTPSPSLQVVSHIDGS